MKGIFEECRGGPADHAHHASLNINENEKRKQATIKGLISHVEEKISEPVTAGKQEYFSTFSMRGAVCGDLTARYSRQILTAIFLKTHHILMLIF